MLEAKIKSRRAPHKKVMPRNKRSTKPKLKINFYFLKRNQSKHQVVQQKSSEAIKNEPHYAALANSSVAATKEISPEIDKPKPDWFEGSKHELIELIDVRNTAHIYFIQ
jgi:hypothetical protein